MRPDQQAHVASVVRECRERLQRIVTGDGDPSGGVDLGPTDLGPIAARLMDVETALEVDARHRQRRSLSLLARELSTSRMTATAQHPPEPLTVPRRYLRATPPVPAPTLTLVTPSFEQAEFLERTIQSVIDQGYPALEYVIRDGGSTDGSLDILRRHSEFLTRWESAPDGGQADAINLGFAGSTGEIMAFLNSDDLLLPGALCYVANYFARHPKIDVVYGHRMLIDEHDRLIGSWVVPRRADRVLRWGDYIPQETLFWRRRIWDAAGGRMDSSFSFAIDWDLLLRLRDAGARMTRLPRFIGTFRVHDTQKHRLMLDACEQESAILRARANGHPVSGHVAHAHCQRFIKRHALLHTAYSARRLLPTRRFEVPVGP